MPFVRGRSLKDRIAAGPLSLKEALDIAEEVAEGIKRPMQEASSTGTSSRGTSC